jgi:type I site-specific restriction endonuclease
MAPPKDQACEPIDQALEQAGWRVQDYKSAHLHAGRGVVLRNFPLLSGHCFADYLLYIDGKTQGSLRRNAGALRSWRVEVQSVKYSQGLPAAVPAPARPLPFPYESFGVETRFTNDLNLDKPIILEKIKEAPVPLLTLTEQLQIVAEVEFRLSVTEELEAAVQANLTRADRLRQSILGKVFTGQLVTRKGRVKPC